VAACHKWLSAPKGSAFLYARPEVHHLLDPLVISRGFGYEPVNGRSSLVAWQEAQGTRDVSAFLSVPAAIRFQAEHDWDTVRARCHALAVTTRDRVHAMTGLEVVSPEDWFSQLVSIRLPDSTDLPALHRALWEDHRIEVPIGRWNGQAYVRVSFQAYNDESDADALVQALQELLLVQGLRLSPRIARMMGIERSKKVDPANSSHSCNSWRMLAYPLMPVRLMPSTNVRWVKKKMMIMGRVNSTDAAIRRPHSRPYWLLYCCRPSDSVYCFWLFR
jgi:aspartate aminotransferase-like enzyme